MPIKVLLKVHKGRAEFYAREMDSRFPSDREFRYDQPVSVLYLIELINSAVLLPSPACWGSFSIDWVAPVYADQTLILEAQTEIKEGLMARQFQVYLGSKRVAKGSASERVLAD